MNSGSIWWGGSEWKPVPKGHEPKAKKERYIVIGSNGSMYGTYDTLEQARTAALDALEGVNVPADPETGYEPERPRRVSIVRGYEVIKASRNNKRSLRA